METAELPKFIPSINRPLSLSPDDLWFIVNNASLLVKVNKGVTEIPRYGELGEMHSKITGIIYLGTIDGRHCYAATLDNTQTASNNFEFQPLRINTAGLPDVLFGVIGRARHLLHWNTNSRFCGRCGAENRDKIDERAKLCPSCGRIEFPRISPAVIVAVTRGNELLLARGKGSRLGFHSVLAGFVEPGESFEECVRREIFEEVGIEVDNIKYFGSQPWPFPESLMVGFTAEHARGEIAIDNVEIETAGWFTAGNPPPIPPKGSISRALIDWFLLTRKG
jgi:NAD+ diphosphatase